MKNTKGFKIKVINNDIDSALKTLNKLNNLESRITYHRISSRNWYYKSTRKTMKRKIKSNIKSFTK